MLGAEQTRAPPAAHWEVLQPPSLTHLAPRPPTYLPSPLSLVPPQRARLAFLAARRRLQGLPRACAAAEPPLGAQPLGPLVSSRPAHHPSALQSKLRRQKSGLQRVHPTGRRRQGAASPGPTTPLPHPRPQFSRLPLHGCAWRAAPLSVAAPGQRSHSRPQRAAVAQECAATRAGGWHLDAACLPAGQSCPHWQRVAQYVGPEHDTSHPGASRHPRWPGPIGPPRGAAQLIAGHC